MSSALRPTMGAPSSRGITNSVDQARRHLRQYRAQSIQTP
jgi:hypothetical protein